MASPLYVRQFRRNRVLVRHAEDGTVLSHAVLLETPEPNKWDILTVERVHGSALYSTGRDSHDLSYDYDEIVYNSHYSELTKEELDLLVSVAAAYGLTGAVIDGLRTHADKHTGAVSVKAATVTVADAEAPTAARSKAASFVAPDPVEAPYWYESANDSRLYRDFLSLCDAGHIVNLLISGPSGSGKTVGIQRLGKELGIPVHIVNCQAITTPEKWIGQMQASVSDGTFFEPSQHIQWVERTHPDCEGFDKCIILYDEITRLRAELNNMTYSLFDTQRGLEVPQMGRRVVMSSQNYIVATANLGAAYTGTHTQDRAFRERFALTIERDFPPYDEEVKVLTMNTGISTDDAQSIVRVAGHTREMWRRDELESPISTRTNGLWALLVSGGYTLKEAADYTVLPMFSDDGGSSSDRAKVSASIEGKVADPKF